MNAKELTIRAIERIEKLPADFHKKITNEIFTILEKDHELRKEYDKLSNTKGTGVVNRMIGKIIKNIYGLVNAKERENHPTCSLISSHQIFVE